MREIKFRGYNEATNKWVYGYLSKAAEHFFIECEKGVYPIDKNSIGQYTGLNDKDGKEIYERDIVQQNYKDVYNQRQAFVGEVIYSECVYWIKDQDEYTFLYDEYRLYNCSVVGNTYENPELLEEN